MHIIKVCGSCTCKVRFADASIKRAEQVLGIRVGQTTEDGKFRLEKTGCLSHCEEGPNVMFCKADSPLASIMVDGEVKHGMLPDKLEKELTKLKNDS
jgi:NADH:ubiquinone oxidoreductase subunit E